MKDFTVLIKDTITGAIRREFIRGLSESDAITECKLKYMNLDHEVVIDAWMF